MARVVVTARAERDIRELVRSRDLPTDTPDRIRRSLLPLADFPTLGTLIGGNFDSLRFLLGPWRWMIVIYEVQSADSVVILRVIDGRTGSSPLGNR